MTGTKLASLDNTPLYFRAVSVSIPPGQKISFSARPNGILYQLFGSTEVSAGEPKTITGGGGVLIPGGTTASLTAGNSEQSTLLYFLLVPKEARPTGGGHASDGQCRIVRRMCDFSRHSRTGASGFEQFVEEGDELFLSGIAHIGIVDLVHRAGRRTEFGNGIVRRSLGHLIIFPCSISESQPPPAISWASTSRTESRSSRCLAISSAVSATIVSMSPIRRSRL